MPRPAKGPRLYLRRARRKNGRVIAQAVWIIRDGGKDFATGCFTSATNAQKDAALAKYIALKYKPSNKRRELEEIDCADVLSIYLTAREVDLPKLPATISRLNEFWGGQMLADVCDETCRQFATERKNNGGARRDLETLRAAIRYHAKKGLHRGSVHVWLPAKGLPRDRWLTRGEAAALLWACWRYREKQRIHRGARKGEVQETDKRPLRHLARFILIGLYTGTRAGAVASASPYRAEGNSYVDLDQGIFFRLAIGKRATNKRQPPVPLPPRLLAHMRRWVRKKIVTSHFVEWAGHPVSSVKTAFKRAVAVAGLTGKVTPHTLRHTAATWLMQRGVSEWFASGYLGMSPETLRSVYGHHHPEFLREAANAIGTKGESVPVVISVADAIARRQKSAKRP
jgi:integrase